MSGVPAAAAAAGDEEEELQLDGGRRRRGRAAVPCAGEQDFTADSSPAGCPALHDGTGDQVEPQASGGLD